MNSSFTKRLGILVGTTMLLIATYLFGFKPRTDSEGSSGVKTIFVSKLPNVPGKTLTATTVSYAPGGKTPEHYHAGSVFAYVLSGAIRSENSKTGPARVYEAGETFFEPPDSIHLISENASQTEPASLLAVIIADDGAQLTTFIH